MKESLMFLMLATFINPTVATSCKLYRKHVFEKSHEHVKTFRNMHIYLCLGRRCDFLIYMQVFWSSTRKDAGYKTAACKLLLWSIVKLQRYLKSFCSVDVLVWKCNWTHFFYGIIQFLWESSFSSNLSFRPSFLRSAAGRMKWFVTSNAISTRCHPSSLTRCSWLRWLSNIPYKRTWSWSYRAQRRCILR